MTRIVLCCGTGGVGKTTTAAAVGVAWAMHGARACVLTIDPARRLADALGLDQLDNQPRRVALAGLDLAEGGSLHALMLDRKATFDESIRRLSDDEDAAARLLANRYYRAVSTRLTGSQEYMATEKLYELLHSGDFDVIVVDTPPSQHAIEFFHAPERVQRLFDGPVMSRLVNPGRGLTGGGTRRLLRWLLSLVGQDVLDDIGEFFKLMSHVSSGFAEHSADVAKRLRSSDSHLLLVTSPATVARQGALAFLAQAREDGLSVDGFVINRFIAPSGATFDDGSAPGELTAEAWQAWAAPLAHHAARKDAIAKRHARAARDLSKAGGDAPVWALPYMPFGLRSADGLASLAAFLPPLGKATTLD